ncbi:MAG: IS1634 family transposase [Bacilli bacterium]|nr:IS1634 family transposase [Bacilli bacterium]
MRLRIIKSKNSTQYAIIKDYTTSSGKRTTSIYENLGNQEKVELRFGKDNTIIEITKYINSLNEDLKQGKAVLVNLIKNPNKKIEKNIIRKFNVGYLFLKDIYYSLNLDKMCKEIQDKYKFEFDLNCILECLIYSRILWPSSKLSTYKQSNKFAEKISFEYQHIIRSLDYLSKEFDFIQKFLFDNSNKIMDRNYKVIYYDCTNFFFYTEENDFQKYGISKEHQPLPLVQMGLFMDADGLPFALNINPGNTSETTTMIPSEEKFLKEYNMDGKNIVVCTDAAMCTDDIKKFNVQDGRGFVITQSIKKLKNELKEWAVDSDGWRILGNLVDIYNIKDIENDDEKKKIYYDKTFYKEIECDTKSVNQTLIVTFSFKYQTWQKNIREKQFERATKLVNEINEKNKKATKKKDVEQIKISKNPNDPKRFIKEIRITNDGEVANNIMYDIDKSAYEDETKYDGFYGITTNLIDDTKTVIKVMNGRWEIEESFRIMKEEFDSDNAYLSKENRIKAHFLTCYLALFVYRYLEHKLNDKYTVYEIIECLRDMEVLETKGDGYLPAYIRTDLTDDLHQIFGINTDTEIISYKKFKEILSKVKVK